MNIFAVLFAVALTAKPLTSNGSDLLMVTRSLLDLIDELSVHIEVKGLAANADFTSDLNNLRYFYSSLIARDQPTPTSSYDIFQRRILKPFYARHGIVDEPVPYQSVLGCMQHVGPSTFMKASPDRITLYSAPDEMRFKVIDRIPKEHIIRKTEKILVNMLKIHTTDNRFQAACHQYGFTSNLHHLQGLLKDLVETFKG